MGKKRQAWKAGDIFTVPLEKGVHGIGQIFSAEPEALNSVLCMFFSNTADSTLLNARRPSRSALIAVQLTTRDQLDSHEWKVIGNDEPHSIADLFALDQHRAKRFVGSKIRGSGIMRNFLNAFHGLAPWDPYLDPTYFDKLLVAGVPKPAAAYSGKPMP